MRKLLVPLVTLSGVALFAASGVAMAQQKTTGAAAGSTSAVVGGSAGTNHKAAVKKMSEATQATKKKATEASAKIKWKKEATHATSADRMGKSALTNAQVRKAQTALQGLGLYKGEIDGLYGNNTIRAVNEFQERNKLPRTGMLNAQTQTKLEQVASAGTMKQTQNASHQQSKNKMAPQPKASMKPGTTPNTKSNMGSSGTTHGTKMKP